MGKLEYKQTWIILLTSKAKKRKKSEIFYLKKTLTGSEVTRSPEPWNDPVKDDDFIEFDTYDQALYHSRNLSGYGYCVTIAPHFRRPKLKRDQAEWGKLWSEVLWKPASLISRVLRTARKRSRRSATVSKTRPAARASEVR